MLTTCEEHDGVFIFDSQFQTKCPVCSEIEDLEDRLTAAESAVEET